MNTVRELFDRHASSWPDQNMRILRRLDDLLLRDEVRGFRLPQSMRSQLVSLYNAIDLHTEANRGGCDPWNRSRCLAAVRRILDA